jgi:3-oxoacyl-[acyl-carrier protein] reductase
METNMTSTLAPARKVAMVFGGSRGIGAAAALRLAREGFAVALTYVAQPDKAAEVVESIKASGGEAVAIAADSRDPAAIRAAVDEAVKTLGKLDVAVVNAGVIRIGLVETFSLEDLDEVISVNIRGVYLAIQAAAQQMHDGGRIITIGSNTAIRTGTPGAGVYAMSKAAVAAMAQGVALDLAPRRITVNNVQPGPTETDMSAGMAERLSQMSPLRRIAQPEEIAGMVSYLAREEAGYVTGASLTIDGGFVL